MALLIIMNEVEFRIRKITRDKGHYVMIKGLIHQEDITILFILLINKSPNYKKQNRIDLKGEIKSELYVWMSTLHFQ